MTGVVQYLRPNYCFQSKEWFEEIWVSTPIHEAILHVCILNSLNPTFSRGKDIGRGLPSFSQSIQTWHSRTQGKGVLATRAPPPPPQANFFPFHALLENLWLNNKLVPHLWGCRPTGANFCSTDGKSLWCQCSQHCQLCINCETLLSIKLHLLHVHLSGITTNWL